MRRNIVHAGAGSLSYAIREIVLIARKFAQFGLDITWENIGDPIAKGEPVAPWIRQTLHTIIDRDAAWAYCDTAGVPEAREFIARQVNIRGGAQITPSDILFFNGLGEAINKVYSMLRREARVIGPSPAYSAHSSAEAVHSGLEHMTYDLDPHQGWLPDVEDLRMKVRYNDSIAGILLVNPNNPTSTVYPRRTLEEVVAIARQYKLFIICDEIYCHIVYNGQKALHLSEVIGDVCAIVMRGISKEYPWPGSRCGWIEVLNREADHVFHTYVDSLLAAKRMEVCSTTMPQLSIPLVMGDERYVPHLRGRAEMFEKRAGEATAAFAGIPGVHVVCPSGAFYFTVMFEQGVLNDRQQLSVGNDKARKLVEELMTPTMPMDQRFVYWLMAATGICTVPLSGFYCRRDGFRTTLLECDDAKRNWTYQTIAAAIREYLKA
jgi:aspartate/methionine/tyrosine aminotransferase